MNCWVFTAKDIVEECRSPSPSRQVKHRYIFLKVLKSHLLFIIYVRNILSEIERIMNNSKSGDYFQCIIPFHFIQITLVPVLEVMVPFH